MLCPTCQSDARKFGKDRAGNQRYQCPTCRKTFSQRPARLLGDMRLDIDRAVTCLHHLVEGTSVRATARLVGTNRTTILELLDLIGERCNKLLLGRIKGVPVVDVQADEIWSFVGMKEKTRKVEQPDETYLGDAYCYVGIERHSKLILAWHLGKRDEDGARTFAFKLGDATAGQFQITTDGFQPYRSAIPAAMSTADFAQLVKKYAELDGTHRYSPAIVTGTTKTPRNGHPDPERVCTSHVERQNLTIRMQNRRLTRLTNAFSKKWRNHAAALALHFAYYNFCRPHSTLTKEREGVKTSPAMAAGLENHLWTIRELVENGSTL